MDDRYKFVREQLERRQKYRQLSQVAKNADVARRTLCNILEAKDVRLSTLDKLHKYLKENAKRRDL